eukprot:5155449-Pleurochrysis_carterae.AAC.2
MVMQLLNLNEWINDELTPVKSAPSKFAPVHKGPSGTCFSARGGENRKALQRVPRKFTFSKSANARLAPARSALCRKRPQAPKVAPGPMSARHGFGGGAGGGD